jgi:hypothetical protein
MRLSQRPRARGFAPQLEDADYVRLVFPGTDRQEPAIRDGEVACNGRSVFGDAAFRGAAPEGGFPVPAKEGMIFFGGGANRLRIVWFRTHQLPGGRAAGPIAIVRTLDEHAEVYAIGAYAGSREKTRLGLERMGTDVVLTAVDDGCTGVNPGQACDSTLHVYFPFRGELAELAAIGLERVRPAEGTEPGVAGPVEYRLLTTTSYEDDGIKLLEQVSATAADGRKLRRAELERFLKRVDGRVVASDVPLWDRMYAKRGGGAEGAPGSPKGPEEDVAPGDGDGVPLEP